jgi:AcrR family transcriptional regulator
MRINELVKEAGVPRTTVHYYLRIGLLHPPRKTGRTMAYYDDSHVQRLKQIDELKKGARVPISFLKEQIEKSNKISPSSPADYDVTKTVVTTKEKVRKREEIIKAAIRVFSRKGYHQTKVIDITTELKISTGTFYLYFQNKRDLFIEVIDQVFRAIVGDAAIAIKGEDNFFDRMKIRGRVFYENYTRYNEILNQLRAEIASEEDWPQDQLKKIYHGLTKPVIREVTDAVEAGILRKVDPDLLAYSLTGLIEMMSLRVSLDKKYRYEDIEAFIFDSFIKPIIVGNKVASSFKETLSDSKTVRT